MKKGSIFKSNTSQAVRLPKAVAFPESVKQVDIVPLGRSLLLSPAGESWEIWFASEGVTADFMQSRDQPKDQDREGF